MKFIDLFAGIGGFHFGMQQAGHECVGWVEMDQYARTSYQAIHPGADKLWNAVDITDVKASEIPSADVWCFGFPCQDISVAGKMKGINNGPRSSLFFTVTQLLRETPQERKPAYLFAENVKNLLSINSGWDFLQLQAELDEIGYDTEWAVLDSAKFVPQHRERIFIIGHLRERDTGEVFPIGRKDPTTAQANRIRELTRVNPKRHAAEGNSILDTAGISQTVSARCYKDPMKVLIKQLGNISTSKSFGGNPQTGRVYDPNGIAPTLSTMQGGSQEPKILEPKDRLSDPAQCCRVRKLTPKECWRLQGFPDEAFEQAKATGMSDSQLYKQADNSVTVPVIKAIAERFQFNE